MKKKISAFLASMLLLGSIGGAAMAEGMTPGTYEAAAQGFHGDVKLSVTVDAEKITAIDILEHSETEGIGAAEAGGSGACESDDRCGLRCGRDGDV